MNIVSLRNNSMENTAELIQAVLSDIKKANLKISDSDMFAYCEFYTGDFWQSKIKKAA